MKNTRPAANVLSPLGTSGTPGAAALIVNARLQCPCACTHDHSISVSRCPSHDVPMKCKHTNSNLRLHRRSSQAHYTGITRTSDKCRGCAVLEAAEADTLATGKSHRLRMGGAGQVLRGRTVTRRRSRGGRCALSSRLGQRMHVPDMRVISYKFRKVSRRHRRSKTKSGREVRSVQPERPLPPASASTPGTLAMWCSSKSKYEKEPCSKADVTHCRQSTLLLSSVDSGSAASQIDRLEMRSTCVGRVTASSLLPYC